MPLRTVGKYTHALVPPAVDPPEPAASGTVTYVDKWDPKTSSITYEATVSCSGLTPGQEYQVAFCCATWLGEWEGYGIYDVRQTVAADKHGRLTAGYSLPPQYWYGGGLTHICDTWVENDAGEIVLEEVR